MARREPSFPCGSFALWMYSARVMFLANKTQSPVPGLILQTPIHPFSVFVSQILKNSIFRGLVFAELSRTPIKDLHNWCTLACLMISRDDNIGDAESGPQQSGSHLSLFIFHILHLFSSLPSALVWHLLCPYDFLRRVSSLYSSIADVGAVFGSEVSGRPTCWSQGFGQ